MISITENSEASQTIQLRMSTTQDIVDSLIDHIDKAITKGSVTNQQLSRCL